VISTRKKPPPPPRHVTDRYWGSGDGKTVYFGYKSHKTGTRDLCSGGCGCGYRRWTEKDFRCGEKSISESGVYLYTYAIGGIYTVPALNDYDNNNNNNNKRRAIAAVL